MTDELASRADTIVIGRTSFQAMAGFWSAVDTPLGDWMNGTPKVVLSNTIDDASAWHNSTVVAGDGVAAVRRLKAGAGKAIVVFGGVQTVTGLVADLALTSGDLDEIETAAAQITVQGARYPEHLERLTGR